MKIRVYYEDTDLGGITYHANYIKFCERARSEAFFENSMMPALGEKDGFVVRHMDVNFLATSTLGDLLTVTTKVAQIKNTSLVLRQEVYKEEKMIFSMVIALVYIDKGKPCRIPEVYKDFFKKDYY